jgi:hypothetical protein
MAVSRDAMVLDAKDFQQSQHEGDKRLLAKFYKNAIFNEFKSNEAGRHIYDEIDYIRVITPGSRDDFHTEATQQYKDRFPEQWARYKSSQDQAVSGTPIDMVPWLTIGQVQELKYFNISTVEQLVAAPDSIAQKFLGFHNLRAKAKSFLDSATAEAEKTKLESALRERDDKITELSTSVASLTAKLDELLKKHPTK